MSVGRKVDRTGRSKNERFVALPFHVLNGEAFRRLSGPGTRALIAVCHEFNGSNNGNIPFSNRDGRAWRMSQSKTKLALNELIEAGLLIRTNEGKFSRKRLPATWALSWRPMARVVAHPLVVDRVISDTLQGHW